MFPQKWLRWSLFYVFSVVTDLSSGHFKIKLHHGGVLWGISRRDYLGGSVNSFHYCHSDEMSLTELCNMANELGLGPSNNYYFKRDWEYELIKSDGKDESV